MPSKTESEALARYWQQHIEACQPSGQIQQACCKANELSYHCFGYWSRKFRHIANHCKVILLNNQMKNI